MKAPHERILSIFALCVVVFSAAYVWSIWKKMSYQPQARQEMKNFYDRVKLGDSKAQVQQVFISGNYQTLKLRGIQQEDAWIISTPFEFGAGNWVLYIEYDAGGRVGAMRLRTNDSVNERPREPAPDDKISPTWTEPFPASLSNKRANKALHPTAYSPALVPRFGLPAAGELSR